MTWLRLTQNAGIIDWRIFTIELAERKFETLVGFENPFSHDIYLKSDAYFSLDGDFHNNDFFRLSIHSHLRFIL